MALYIVGFGTLLYTESVGDSLGKAAAAKLYHPVIVRGFKRLFNLLPSHYKPSYRISDQAVERAAANIIPSEEDNFNGVAFEVSPEELAAIDSRESHYRRIETIMFDFNSGKPLGNAYVYSAVDDHGLLTSDPSYLPDWEDISWARTGAYRHGEAFGRMYDETTFLADGKTLVVKRYEQYLDQLIIKQ
jgi:hypothetical protein